MNTRPPTLARNLTYRLTWILLLTIVMNVIVVGAYYSADQASLEREAIEKQLSLLQEVMESADPALPAQATALYRSYPQSYGFALLDAKGHLLDAENIALIPPEALETDLFTQHWQTRLTTADGEVILMSTAIQRPEGKVRLVFVMHDDPGYLVQRALGREFLTHIWIPILPVAVIMLAANHFMIRRGLSPVTQAANWARTIQPGHPAPPLKDTPLPAEIDDLVHSTQRTLERLNMALVAEQRRGAEIAHALRTPIAVLTARLAALPDGEIHTKLRADLAALSRTVHQVLASSKADSLDISSLSRCDLNNIARDVIAALAPFAYQNGVSLSLHPASEPVIVKAAPEGVELALTNLVENAVLHSNSQRVDIRVSPGGTLSVLDFGDGIAIDALAHLFDAFWRGENASPGGSGLGLAIVQRLQLAQKGTIKVSNHTAGGAEFVLVYQRS